MTPITSRLSPSQPTDDASELAAHCAALTERNAELARRNAELEARLRSLCRDLRVPVEGILDVSAGLSERLLPGARAELAKVEEAAKRITETMEAMLRLTRISQTEISRRPVNLSDLAERVTEELRAREPSRSVTVEIQPSLDASGDAWMLRVLLEGLLSNAWRFTAERPSATVRVGCENRAGENVFFVRDDGAGFDRADAGRLFRPFERLHPALSGTGLGLVTVQGVVERHGGRVWADSQPGQGATFYFTLGAHV